MSETNEPRWNEVEDISSFVKWEEEGQELEGLLLRLDDGAMGGKIAVLQDADGKEMLASAPTILARKLADAVNKWVKIQFTGKKKFSSGRVGKDFRVFVRAQD